MQAQSTSSLWDMGRYISPCLSCSKCVPGWRGTLRGNNSTVKWFQQTKLCPGLPKINTEHLYRGKQTLGVVLFLNICCILMSESSSLQLRLTLKVSRGTESQVRAVSCGAAHHMPGCLLGCSGSPCCTMLGAQSRQGLPMAQYLSSPA